MSATPYEQTRAAFAVYGLTVVVEGWAAVVDAVRLDLAWFESVSPSRGDVRVSVARRRPDLGRFGDLAAAFVTPRNAVFRRGRTLVVDHVGAAVSVIEEDGDRMTIEGEDEAIVHDAVYYFLLSRIGQHLDAVRLPRVHGLGLAGPHGAVLVLLPSGGGKTTLALHALEQEGVRLLSDDSPLLDTRGRMHPFPLRLGVNAADRLPGTEEARAIERLFLETKVAIEVRTFADRIAPSPAPVRAVVLGTRSLAREGRLERTSRGTAIPALVREAVIGVGLYQGLGYAHQQGARTFAAKVVTSARRARCAAAALRRADAWRLRLGRDPETNWAALRPLVVGGAAGVHSGLQAP